MWDKWKVEIFVLIIRIWVTLFMRKLRIKTGVKYMTQNIWLIHVLKYEILLIIGNFSTLTKIKRFTKLILVLSVDLKLFKDFSFVYFSFLLFDDFWRNLVIIFVCLFCINVRLEVRNRFWWVVTCLILARNFCRVLSCS